MSDPNSLYQPCVLLVEDDDVSATLATVILHHLGCEVTRVGDGESAVRAARDGAHHCILMDWQLPDMTGLDATRRIRAERGPALPIIGLTAHRGREEHQACLQAGMDDVLTKPTSIAQVRAMLETWIVVGLPSSTRADA